MVLLNGTSFFSNFLKKTTREYRKRKKILVSKSIASFAIKFLTVAPGLNAQFVDGSFANAEIVDVCVITIFV